MTGSAALCALEVIVVIGKMAENRLREGYNE